jgi:hypothetical protein
MSDLDSGGNSVYLDTYRAETFSYLYLTDPVGVGENLAVNASFTMSKIPDDGKVYVSLGNLMPSANENQLKYYGLEGDKVIYIFEPEYTSGTFQLQTAHFDGELSMDLSAYKFKPESIAAKRTLYEFSGSFDPSYITNLTAPITYTFHVPYHYDGIVVEVEMRGLEIDVREDKLPENWDNWRELSNGVYGVQYKPDPTNYLDEVEVNLLPTILDASQECTITLQAPGYKTLTSKISVTQTIPAGNLRTSTDIRDYTPLYIYSTNPGTNTNLTALASINAITRGGTSGNRVYYNTNAVQISGVSPDDTLYIRYSISYNQYYTIYYVASFKLSDAVNGQVTLNFQQVRN